MKILDLTAGNRAIWYDKVNPLVVFLDKRPEVDPTFICDTKNIPPEVGNDFDLIVYDPPHMNCGPNSNMSKIYGHHTTKQILEDIKATGSQAHKISRSNALMALKWNDHDIKLKRILDLLPQWKPLFGHSVSMRQKHKSQTYWTLLLRIDL